MTLRPRAGTVTPPRPVTAVMQYQRSPVRSRRCPATVVPLGGEPGRLSCVDEMALEGRAVRRCFPRPRAPHGSARPAERHGERRPARAGSGPAGTHPEHPASTAASTARAGTVPGAGGRQRPVPRRSRQRLPLPAALLGCGALLLVSMILGVAVGSVPLSPAAVLRVIADHLEGHAQYSVADAIVWEIRLPRVLLAAVVGAALTTAGTVVQVLVRNALADPFLLGVSSGASVGRDGGAAVRGVRLARRLGDLGGQRAWRAGGDGRGVRRLAAGRGLAPTQLILCGVVLSALFESVTSFLIFRGNPQATQSVLFWLLGSFGLASWNQLPIPVLALVAVMIYLLAQSRSLNALAMGAEPAAALGVDVQGCGATCSSSPR